MQSWFELNIRLLLLKRIDALHSSAVCMCSDSVHTNIMHAFKYSSHFSTQMSSWVEHTFYAVAAMPTINCITKENAVEVYMWKVFSHPPPYFDGMPPQKVKDWHNAFGKKRARAGKKTWDKQQK